MNTGASLGGGAGVNFSGKKTEALCSSCILKPENFQYVARDHDSFHVQAWNVISLSHKVFSGPQNGDVDAVPRFIMYKQVVFKGAGKIGFLQK